MRYPSARSVRSYLQHLAGWVWREQDDAIHYGLKLQEETITEMLLLRMARETQDSGLHIKMFNRIEEGGDKKTGKVGNGADWEWYFDTPYCQIGFRIQAKVLSSNLSPRRKALTLGSYEGLHTDGEQARDLIKAATAISYNPVFVFYNHPWVANRDLFSSIKSGFPVAPTDWGCAVAAATFIRDKGNNRLSELVHGMVPWHRFFSLETGCGAKSALNIIGADQQFFPKAPRPEWLEMLNDSGAEDEGAEERLGLNQYLLSRKLAGVAYFGFQED